MSIMHCAITNCKMTLYNKPPNVIFYSCPQNSDMRNKWLQALKNKCSMLDWSKSKICSRHFENKYFDSQRKLKENAVPTIFNTFTSSKVAMNTSSSAKSKSKLDRILSRMTQSEINADIRNCRSRLKEPNVDMFVSDYLKYRTDTPLEVKLWLEIKKQEHLNARLTEQISQHKRHIDTLQKNLEQTRSGKKEMEHNIDGMKYIVKCLQEKHASLEEQIEILTAVESR